jgi:hypothetical protein
MKKIIILLILFFNINIVDNSNSLRLNIGNVSIAQPNDGNGGPNPCAGGGGGGASFQWWFNFTNWLTSNTTWSWIGELFSGSGGWGNTSVNQYPNFGGSIYPTGYFNQYNVVGNGGGGTAGTSGSECSAVYGGMIDKCGACVGGSTQAIACDAVVLNDTLKPEKYPCPTDAVARDLKSDSIFNSIKDSAITKNAIDSAPFRKFEVGFTIRQYAQPNCSTCYWYKPTNYNSAGNTQNVSIDNIHYNCIADGHTHTDTSATGTKINPSPSPYDYIALMGLAINPFYTNGFTRRFIFSGDSARSNYATVAHDTAKNRLFLTSNPLDSVIDTNPNSQHVGNWKKDTTKVNSYFNQFQDAVNLFTLEGYPKRLIDTYANVYMLHKLDLGIKLQTLVNGSFKELKFEQTTDSTNKIHYKIKICE